MEIFIECGRKRKGERAACKRCDTEFLRRINGVKGKKKIFCTKECADKESRRRQKIKCNNCGKEIERTLSKIRSSKHGISFCGRECKEFAQSLDGGCKEIQPAHYGQGTGEHSYRERCKKKFKKGCVGCKEKKRYKLTVHHIDGDRTNNAQKNLEVVCWNCHAVRHLRLIDGEWRFSYRSLTPRNMIKALT